MRKKLFAILMSAMMMVTFMPSMAFADATDWSDPQKDEIMNLVARANNIDYSDLAKIIADKTKADAEAKALKDEADAVAAYFAANYHEVSYDYVVPGTETKHHYTNPKMAPVKGETAHLTCGVDFQVYKCTVANCNFKTWTIVDTTAAGHAKATTELMSYEDYMEAVVQEEADAFMADLNEYAAFYVTAGTVVAATETAKLTAEITKEINTRAAEAAKRLYALATGKSINKNGEVVDAKDNSRKPWKWSEEKKLREGLEKAFKKMFNDLLPWNLITDTVVKGAKLSLDVAKFNGSVALAVAGGIAEMMDVYYGLSDGFGINDICKMAVTVCPECGITDAFVIEHQNKKGSCATHFTCDVCEKEVWNVRNILNPQHTLFKIYDTSDTINVGKDKDGKDITIDPDLVLPAGKLAKEELDCTTVAGYKCSDCDEHIVALNLRKQDGHKFETKTIVKPTCLTKGASVDVCSVCGLITNFQVLDKAEKHVHAVTDTKVVEATCSTAGYTVEKCSCGKIMGVKDVKPFKGHNYQQKTIVEGTCEAAGLYEIYCADCGKAKFFSYDEDSELVEITTDGEKSYEKTVELSDIIPGNILATIVKFPDALPGNVTYEYHNEVIDVMTKDVRLFGVDKDWTHNYYFTGFGVLGVADRLVNPLPIPASTLSEDGKHDFGVVDNKSNLVKIANATCTSPELWAAKCKDCGAIDAHGLKAVKIGKALPHDLKTVVVEPSCGEGGYTYTYCTVCQNYFDSYGDLAGKDMVKYAATAPKIAKGVACVSDNDWVTVKDPTFTKVGTRVTHCVNCGVVCEKDDVGVKKLAKAYQPTLKAGKKSFTAKFKNVGEAATGVQIAYKVTGANNYKYVKTTFKKSKTVKGLKSGKKYTVKVRKYKTEGETTVYGKWCAVKYVTVK